MSMAFRQFAEEQGFSDETDPEIVVLAVREFTQVRCKDDRTKQGDKEAADINVIVRRNLDAGLMPGAGFVPQYGDATVVSDLQSALAIVAGAREDFAQLTARQREAFHNDPMEFVAAATDPTKADLFRSLGMMPAKEEPAPGGAGSSTVPT